MHPRKLIRESVIFAFAQYLVRMGLMLRGIIAARLLGPELYGTWNALLLIMDYGGQSSLGTYEGVDQITPGRIVDKNARLLERLKRAAIFNAILLPVLFGTGVLLYLERGDGSGRILSFWGVEGVVAALVVVLLTSIAFIHLSILRAHDRIPAVSTFFVVQGGLGVGLGLALIPSLGVWGLLWGWLTGTVAGIAYVRWRAPGLVPLVPLPSADSLALLRVGFPMFVYTGSRFVTRTLDRVFILRFLGTLELGYYSLTVMALTLLMYLPDSVSYVLYPQLLRTFRESGGSTEAIRDRIVRAARAISLFVPLLCGLGYLAAQDLVALILPTFQPGVPVVRVVAFGAGGLALSGLSAIVLMTLGRRNVLIPVSLGITILTAMLDYLVVTNGHGIQGVAWVTFSVYILNGCILFLFAMQSFYGGPAKTVVALTRKLAPIAISAILAVGLDRFVPPAPSDDTVLALGRLGMVLGVFAVAYLLAVKPLARGLGMRQLLSEFRIPGLSGAGRNGEKRG